MSYSAFFTSGLSLASQPHNYDSLSDAQNVPPQASASVRTRRRQSSLSISTSPLTAVKVPPRTADERSKPLRTPTPTGGATSSGARSRRKTVSNGQGQPALPAPTTPLPPLPPHLAARTRPSPAMSNNVSTSSAKEVPTSSPISVEPSTIVIGSRRNNPSRRSSSALPPFSVVRGLFSPSAYGNPPSDMSMLMEEKHSAVRAN